jgi:hypothetical protein
MPDLTPLCTIDVTLDFQPIGKLPTGMKIDVPFEGTATSPHWEGEWKVQGVDYVTIGADGVQQLDIRARISDGKRSISYRATGRGTNETGPQELLTFETADDDMAWLNAAVAVAHGSIDGNKLHLDVNQITP